MNQLIGIFGHWKLLRARYRVAAAVVACGLAAGVVAAPAATLVIPQTHASKAEQVHAAYTPILHKFGSGDQVRFKILETLLAYPDGPA